MNKLVGKINEISHYLLILSFKSHHVKHINLVQLHLALLRKDFELLLRQYCYNQSNAVQAIQTTV